MKAHFDRARDATWPNLTGDMETQRDTAAKIIDRVLLRATEIEYKDDKDPRVGRIVKYRAPGEGQIPTPGLHNTGPGVMYNDQGIVHLMDKERTQEQRAEAQAKIDARKARKLQRRLEQDS